MRLTDWLNIGVVAVAIIGGVAYVGELKGRVGGLQEQVNQLVQQVGLLDVGAIAEAEAEAAGRLRALAKSPVRVPEDFNWKQGQGEVEMIGRDEGFCYLTRITGKFEGGGEAVSIYVKGSSWYLGGNSKQVDVAARAKCWRWPAG